MEERGTLLRVEGLKTYFFQRNAVLKAVDGVNFTVREGEAVGLVGESGSGKTMTCLSLMRLVPRPGAQIVDGQVWFRGRTCWTSQSTGCGSTGDSAWP